ncbi:MAG: phage tail assembly chaperone [Novosphingobium sp.]|nr:phage tail assembly chaperone [Novosphingobium sp.]
MSASFGQRAAMLYGLAARCLGWRPADFWEATPAELVAALSPSELRMPTGLTRKELERLMDIDNA